MFRYCELSTPTARFTEIAILLSLVSCGSPSSEAHMNAQAVSALRDLMGVQDQTTIDELMDIAYRYSFVDKRWPDVPSDESGTRPIAKYIGSDGKERTLRLQKNGESIGTQAQAEYPVPIPLVKKTIDTQGPHKVIVYGTSVTASTLNSDKAKMEKFLEDVSVRSSVPVEFHLVYSPNISSSSPLVLDNPTQIPLEAPLTFAGTSLARIGVVRAPDGKLLGYKIILNIPLLHGTARNAGLSLEQEVTNALANEMAAIFAANKASSNSAHREDFTTVIGYVAALDDKFARLVLGDHYLEFVQVIVKEMKRIGHIKQSQLAPSQDREQGELAMYALLEQQIAYGSMTADRFEDIALHLSAKEVAYERRIALLLADIDRRQRHGRKFAFLMDKAIKTQTRYERFSPIARRIRAAMEAKEWKRLGLAV